MRILLTLLSLLSLVITGCKKDNVTQELVRIEGFIITDALGNQIGVVGDAGNDWQILEWSQLSALEQSFLNFPDTIKISNTVAGTLTNPVVYPNPFNLESRINFNSSDSVKVKLAVVNSLGHVLKTHAFKIIGDEALILSFPVNNFFPSGTALRYYYSFSAAGMPNFKAGYGDVKICRLPGVSYTECFR